jgi:SAM-dependent methyltransferase
MVTKWFSTILQTEARFLARARRRGANNWREFRRLKARGSATIGPHKYRRAKDAYVLATGDAAAYRLEMLHDLYGGGTMRVLLDAGLRNGMQVADIGCGIGSVTSLMGQIVGHEGHVVGFDFSGAQLAQARSRLNPEDGHIRFVEANATDTGWPAESFDMVYCRFLLMHLREPQQALAELFRLLKPNGVIVCEDGDLTSAGSEPASALDAFADLFAGLAPVRGVDYTLGRRLYRLVAVAGFETPQMTFNQPVLARGESKRLLELSVAEAGPAFIEAGLITAETLDGTIAEMRRLAADESVLAVMPRVSQVWAKKPNAELKAE